MEPARFFGWFWTICVGTFCLILAVDLALGLPDVIVQGFVDAETWLAGLKWWTSRSAENGGTVNLSSGFLVLAFSCSLFFGVVSFVVMAAMVRKTRKHFILPIGFAFCAACLYWNNFVHVDFPGRTVGLLERLLSTELGVFVNYVVSVGLFQLTAFYAVALFLWIRDLLTPERP